MDGTGAAICYSMMQMPGPSIGNLRNYLSKAISKWEPATASKQRELPLGEAAWASTGLLEGGFHVGVAGAAQKD
jgi:hypothetical protein